MLPLLLACADPAPPSVDAGSAPQIQLTTAPVAAWVDEGHDAVLAISAHDDRDAPEALRVQAWSSLDGNLGQPALDAEGRAHIVLTAPSRGAHELRVDVTDSDGNVGVETLTFTVNGLPTAPVVALTPASPVTGQDLVAEVRVAGLDPEGEPVTYAWQWLLDDAPTDLAGDVVPGALLASGQTWTVLVTSVDVRGSAGEVGGARAVVGNAPPGGATVSIEPAEPVAGEALACLVGTEAVDPDGDAVHYRIDWMLDGLPWEGPTIAGDHPGDTVPRAWTDAGQAWTCQVVPTDYVSDGDAVRAAVVVGPPRAPAGELDPLDAWTRLVGDAAGDRLGTALAVGDLDGDGALDVATGAPGWDEDRGLVAILPHGSRGELALTDAPTRISSTVAGDELGTALHAADLDGDGYEDLLVGLPDADGAAGLYGGAAWALPGPLHGVLGREQASAALLGADDSAHLGGGLAHLDTGEGRLLAVSGAELDEGRGGLWLVEPSEGERTLAAASAHPLGDSANDALSVQLVTVGDTDGDGLRDLAVGLPGAEGVAADGDAVRDVGGVFLLTADLPEDRLGLDLAELATTHWTSLAEARLGRAVADVGDVDGDGRDDLLACAPALSGAGLDSNGMAAVLRGGRPGAWPLTEAYSTWSGGATALDLCDAATGGVDLDLDGHLDLAFASSFADRSTPLANPGEVWIVYGPIAPGTHAADSAYAHLQGPYDNSLLGSALASGELTGDGWGDLAIGARGWLHGEGETDYVGATITLAGGER